MDNKIKIIGLNNIVFTGDEPQENKDYLASIRCALEEVRNKAKHGEETAPKTYILKVDRLEQIMEIGAKKPLVVRPGKTKSQILRWKLETLALIEGKDPDEMYEKVMQANIEKVEQKIDELRQ